jgi:hypothetical protein
MRRRSMGKNLQTVLKARIFHESLAATTDMVVLPGILGCRHLRRTVQVRLGTNTLRLPGGTPILFALAALRSVPQAGSQFLRARCAPLSPASGFPVSWSRDSNS